MASSIDNQALEIDSGLPAIASSEEAMKIVAGLKAEITASDAVSDDKRHVPDDLISKMQQQGLFGLVMPKNLGGSGLGFADLVRVTAKIGSSSGAAAWVYGVLAGHSWLINLFPEQAQKEIMSDPTTLLGTVFRLGGEVTIEGDGYRLNAGNGRFCSGIDYANWVIIGNAVKMPDGTAEPRFFIVPKSEIEIVDDWHVMGLRGTGSRSIKIDTAYIPAERSCSLADMLAGTTPGAKAHDGAIFRMPFSSIAPFSIVGAPLGIAKGIVDKFAEDLGKKLADADPQMIAEQSATLARIAECGAQIDAATALVIADAEMIDNAKEPEDISKLQQQQIQRNWAYAVQTARHAANRIFEVSGGSAIYDGHPMQRQFRDLNSAAQHFAFTWDKAMTNYGREAAGLSASAFSVPNKK